MRPGRRVMGRAYRPVDTSYRCPKHGELQVTGRRRPAAALHSAAAAGGKPEGAGRGRRRPVAALLSAAAAGGKPGGPGRGRRRLVVALIFAAVVVGGPGGGTPAWAQSEARLSLVAQTPRTAAGPAAVTVQVTGDASELTIRARLHHAVATRSELLAGLRTSPMAPPTAEWEVELGQPGAGGPEVSLVVPDPGPGFGSGVHPLEVELLTAGGTVTDVLRTHVLMIPDEGPGVEPMPVGIVVDLAAPVAHSPDAGARIDPAGLERTLAVAEALDHRTEMPVTVAADPEIFDALSRTGETAALASIQAAAAGNETLLAPWTELDVAGWLAAGRADVVLDGFARARAALEAVGIEAGTISRIGPDRAADTAAWLGANVGATGIVIDGALPEQPGTRLAGPRFVTGPGGNRLPVVEADPALAELLASPGTGDSQDGTELSVHLFLAELWRMALASEAGPAVVLPSNLSGPAVEAVLGTLAGDESGLLQPASAGALLAMLSPDRPVRPDETSPAGVETAGPTQAAGPRAEAEQYLSAYESLIAPNLAATPSLRDLLAASANRSLSAADRVGLLEAVKRQAEAGMRDIGLLDRGGVTITGRAGDLPLTLVNGQSLPVTVALEFSSEGLGFPEGRRQLAVLEPGRNEVLIPIEARSGGVSTVGVAVATPEGGVVLDQTTARVRSAGLAGRGLALLGAAAAGLAAWWIRTARRRPRAPGTDAATVAGAETGLGEGSTAASTPRRVP